MPRPSAVDLTGWRIADRLKRACPVPAQSLAAGEVLRVPVTEPAQLSNQGGLITLLDASGLKVAGVAYTRERRPAGGLDAHVLTHPGGHHRSGSNPSGQGPGVVSGTPA